MTRKDDGPEKGFRLSSRFLRTSWLKGFGRLLDETREKEREIETLKGRLFSEKSADLIQDVKKIDGISVVAKSLRRTRPKSFGKRWTESKTNWVPVLSFWGPKPRARPCSYVP
jgi:alanyl-tRNA synthetase